MSSGAPWVLVPAKKPELAKTRLAPVLPPGRRASLARALLARLLRLLARAREHALIAQVVVVSPDPGLLALARALGAHPLPETIPDLNGALNQAQHYAMRRGAEATLVLPTDLPTLSLTDLAHLVHRAPRAPGVVLAPCLDDEGTNALLQRPPGLIPFTFGPQSATHHTNAARVRGVPFHTVSTPGLDFDLDQPEDWLRWHPGAPIP